jgi:hypothetical protein
MSMSEFEEEWHSWEQHATPFSTQDLNLPGDFSDEDEAFAKELGSLFALDEEVLPPYFVQTLLDSENPRFQPVEHGLERKTRARVFRRLRLGHHIFHLRRPPMASLFTFLPVRSSMIVGAVLILCMCLTVMLTAPSFASGMDILLHGTKIGVKLVESYPAGVNSSHSGSMRNSTADAQPKLTLQGALQQLHGWTMYWPQAIPSAYTLDATYLYQGQQQDWVDGPFMELDYSLHGEQSHGTGLLAIREFKLQPDVNVLQIVKDGAAQTIKINQNGGVQAIYVDGQWVRHNRFLHVWVYGERSELIYQKDGIIFWIVGDPRDGMDKNALLNIANSLQVFHLSQYIHSDNDSVTDMVILMNGDVDGLFTGDLLAIYPDDNSSSTYLSLGSSEEPPSQAPTSKGADTH